MRQTDNLTVPRKCYERTVYPTQIGDPVKKYIRSTCVYLTRDGKCELNACIKNAKGART